MKKTGYLLSLSLGGVIIASTTIGATLGTGMVATNHKSVVLGPSLALNQSLNHIQTVIYDQLLTIYQGLNSMVAPVSLQAIAFQIQQSYFKQNLLEGILPALNQALAPETQLTSTDLVSFTFNLMSGINEFGFNFLIQFSDQYAIDSTGFRAEFQTNPANPSVITMN